MNVLWSGLNVEFFRIASFSFHCFDSMKLVEQIQTYGTYCKCMILLFLTILSFIRILYVVLILLLETSGFFLFVVGEGFFLMNVWLEMWICSNLTVTRLNTVCAPAEGRVSPVHSVLTGTKAKTQWCLWDVANIYKSITNQTNIQTLFIFSHFTHMKDSTRQKKKKKLTRWIVYNSLNTKCCAGKPILYSYLL